MKKLMINSSVFWMANAIHEHVNDTMDKSAELAYNVEPSFDVHETVVHLDAEFSSSKRKSAIVDIDLEPDIDLDRIFDPLNGERSGKSF